MMRFALLLLTLIFVLSGCWYQGRLLPEVVVIGAKNTLRNIYSGLIMLRTLSYSDKQTVVKSARIFVGETWSVQAKKYPDAWFYHYETQGSCEDLQQGLGITVRYEMYDAAGVVVQEDEITLNISSCR